MPKARLSERIKRVTLESTVSERVLCKDHPEKSTNTSAKRQGIKEREESEPVFRRAKVRGRLSNLPQMPLDVLFEIFGYLDPLDVLRLARTTKAFRSVLMSRSAVSLWKRVFENVSDVPSKPHGLAEPSWANFLFTTTCYECLTPRAALSFGAHQVRYCKRCAASKLHTDPFGDPLIRKDVESLGLSDSNVSETTIAVEYPSDGLQLGRRTGAYVWLKVDFQDFKDSYAEVRDDKIKMTHFREQRNKRYAEMVGHAREYGLWASNKQCERSADIDNIRETRFKSIKQKLIDEGWKREIDGLTSAQEILLRKLPSVRVARPLTQRMWPKVELEIIPMLTQFRDARLAKKRATILRRRRQIFADVVDNYAATQSVRGIFPSAADLYVLEGFSAVKKRIEEDPNDVEYTPSAFDDILHQMPQYYEEWISLCTNKLLEVANQSAHVKDAGPPALLDKSSLALVTTIFCCRLCNGTLEYPNILVHECFRRPPRQTYFHLEVTQFIDGLDVLPWIEVPQNRIILLPPTFITDVGLSCGLGAQTMTHDELDSMNIWLAGEDDSEAQAVVRWRKAIQFDRWKQTTYSKTRYTWSRVTDESLIKTYNRFELDFYTKDFSGVLFCAHCLKNFEPTSFVYHMKQHKPDGGAIQMSDFIVDPTLAHQQLFSTSIPSEYRSGSVRNRCGR